MRLILMRHGEAADAPPKGADAKRPLTQRGVGEARAAAQQLKALGWLPTAVMASDATRVVETCAALRAEMGAALPPVEHAEELYLTSGGAIRKRLAKLDAAEHATVLVVGHNPTLSTLATILTGDYVALGTADAALLSVDAADWAEAVQMDGAWQLTALLSE